VTTLDGFSVFLELNGALRGLPVLLLLCFSRGAQYSHREVDSPRLAFDDVLL
jgi:hypothetical protein